MSMDLTDDDGFEASSKGAKKDNSDWGEGAADGTLACSRPSVWRSLAHSRCCFQSGAMGTAMVRGFMSIRETLIGGLYFCAASGWDDGDGSSGKGAKEDDEDKDVSAPAVLLRVLAQHFHCVQDSPSLERRGSFTVLPPDKLAQKQDALVKQAADLLYVEPQEAGVLLRHFGWKEDKVKKEWFADQAKVRVRARALLRMRVCVRA